MDHNLTFHAILFTRNLRWRGGVLVKGVRHLTLGSQVRIPGRARFQNILCHLPAIHMELETEELINRRTYKPLQEGLLIGVFMDGALIANWLNGVLQ